MSQIVLDRITAFASADEHLALRDREDPAPMFGEIVGTSEPLKKVLAQISRVAPTDSTVLIT